MSEQREVSNWNVPNALTTLRIVMVPFFAWALLHDGGGDTTWRWVAFALFTGAMITDKIDGDLARKHGLVTDFGKIADPIADKAITGMAFIGLAIIADFLPAWLWWVAVMARWAWRRGVDSASGAVGRWCWVPVLPRRFCPVGSVGVCPGPVRSGRCRARI